MILQMQGSQDRHQYPGKVTVTLYDILMLTSLLSVDAQDMRPKNTLPGVP